MSCCEKYGIDCREGRDCPARKKMEGDKIDAILARVQVWVVYAAIGAMVTAFWAVVWQVLEVLK